MGVQARIVVYAPDSAHADSAAAAAFTTMADIEEETSDYRVDNVIAKLAKSAGSNEWVEIGSHLRELILQSQRIAMASSGVFDITMGPLTHLWRASRRNGVLPESTEVEKSRALVDWRQIELDGSKARLAKTGMKLDFGGIAKGYAAEAAVRTLARQGLGISLVSIAGDVFAGDAPPGAAGWKVAVVSGQSGAKADDFLWLVQAGCSTSGDVEQMIQNGSTRQSHIIDIRTGMGSEKRKSVTVVAPSGWQSDALATVLYLVDDAEGQKVLDGFAGTRAILYERVGDEVKRREMRSAAVQMSDTR